jgi:hypothetical protein
VAAFAAPAPALAVAQVAEPPSRPRILLVGSTLVAVVIVILALAATGVAIAFKPTASEQAVRVEESVPGKYLPVMPGQGTAPVLDDGSYLPRVVSVTDQPATAGLSVPAQNSANPPAAKKDQPTVAQTVDTLPAPLALPPGGLDLNQWLPAGMGDLSQMFPQAAECTPGDSSCFLRTTGCQAGDIKCLNTAYMACRAGSPACQGTPINQPVTQPTCGGPTGPKCPPLAATATCTTPNDPACEPPPLPASCRTPDDLTSCLSPGALGAECPPGTRCDPAVAPGPIDQNRVSTTTAPLGEVTPPANAPPPSPEAVSPSPAVAVPGPPEASPPPSPPAGVVDPAVPVDAGPPPLTHGGRGTGPGAGPSTTAVQAPVP